MHRLPHLAGAALILVCINSPALAESKLPITIKETCGLTRLTIELKEDPDFEQAVVVITADSNKGDNSRSILTYQARSFGYECRKNLLNWGGFVVFQIACPPLSNPHDPPEACDYKNNFGLIFGSTVLAVPNGGNGRLAAEAFHYPYDKTIPALEPAKLIYKAGRNGN